MKRYKRYCCILMLSLFCVSACQINISTGSQVGTSEASDSLREIPKQTEPEELGEDSSATSSEEVLQSAFDLNALARSLFEATAVSMEGMRAENYRDLDTLTNDELEIIQAFLQSMEVTETDVEYNEDGEGYGKNNIIFFDAFFMYIEWENVSIGITASNATNIMVSYRDEEMSTREFYRGSQELLSVLKDMTKKGG